MADPPRCLLDTNILLRLTDFNDPTHAQVASASGSLVAKGFQLCCTLQNVAEYWNASTRPVDRNGLGLSPVQTSLRLRQVARRLSVLPEPADTLERFLYLLLQHEVRGIQVHDCHLAAVMLVNGVNHILTFNTVDFARYSEIEAIHPGTL